MRGRCPIKIRMREWAQENEGNLFHTKRRGAADRSFPRRSFFFTAYRSAEKRFC